MEDVAKLIVLFIGTGLILITCTRVAYASRPLAAMWAATATLLLASLMVYR